MQKIYLLIAGRTGFDPIHVKCAFSGDLAAPRAIERQFPTPDALERALESVGISPRDSFRPVQAFTNGMPTYIQVSSEIARELGVLE
jgi:hypothetical protein